MNEIMSYIQFGLAAKSSVSDMSNIELGIVVTVCGLVIVFAVLAILIAVISASGTLNVGFSKPKSNKPVKDNKEEKAAPAPAVKPPVVSDGIDSETVAVITAAVYSMYEGTGVTPSISFIKSANGKRRPAWSKAGIAQNTKAF